MYILYTVQFKHFYRMKIINSGFSKDILFLSDGKLEPFVVVNHQSKDESSESQFKGDSFAHMAGGTELPETSEAKKPKLDEISESRAAIADDSQINPEVSDFVVVDEMDVKKALNEQDSEKESNNAENSKESTNKEDMEEIEEIEKIETEETMEKEMVNNPEENDQNESKGNDHQDQESNMEEMKSCQVDDSLEKIETEGIVVEKEDNDQNESTGNDHPD